MKEYLNMLEPGRLVDAFLTKPPDGFKPVPINDGEHSVPAFLTRLDLAVSAEKNVKKWLRRLSFAVPKPKTLFIGTTVSEYALFPPGVEPERLIKTAVAKLKKLGASFLIIKDMPSNSPLLTERENAYSRELMEGLEKSGFFILHGQALAYVPIDFASTEEFLNRFSKSRRKDFKRKLRSFSDITVEEHKTGSRFFSDEAVDALYPLFENVYDQSEVHFDKLTRGFFKTVFQDPLGNGVCFLYRRGEKTLGFNLCFQERGNLVDKYVGFLYPEAKEFNLYFLSWFYNLEYCVRHGLKTFIAGWTDPEIKAYLGATFTDTFHGVYVKNPVLRAVLKRFKGAFESGKDTNE